MLVVQKVCFWYNAALEKRGIESEEDAMNENRREEEEEKEQGKIRQSIAKHESRAS